MKKYIILILIITYSVVGLSQNNNLIESYNVKNVFPVNPEKASFDKYKEVGVSKFTGVPNISINLYNLKNHNIEIPISLNYNSSGIRVNEIASQVGLGWTIFSGGEISRTKKGRRTDDSPEGFIFTTHKSLSVDDMDFTYNHTHNIDTEADEFNLNLPNGKTVKFYFSQDQIDNRYNIKTFPYDHIKIIPHYNGNKIISWIVKDTDGTSYVFGGAGSVEFITHVKSYSFDGNSLPAESVDPPINNNYITSWKLISINNNNNSVSFSYRSEEYDNKGNCTYQGETTTVAYLTNEWGQTIQKSLIGTIGVNLVLKEINTQNVKVKFNEESSFRLDLRYSKRLKDIEIINTISDSIVKKFEFDTDYFQSNDDNVFNSFGCGTPFDLIEIKKRLYLKKLIEKGSNLLESIEYEFKYYDEVILPHRNSYAQDYWGFFNGEVNNMSLMPSYVITKSDGQFLLNASTPEEYFYAVKINGSKRNINPYYTNSCMLKTIKYPSGGITEFVYENNKTSKNAEIKKNLIDYYTPMYNSIDTNLDPLSVLDNDYYIISKPFVLTSAYGDALGIDYTTFQSNCYQDPTLPNIDCSRFNIKNTDTGQYIFQVNKSLNFDGTVSEISNTSQSIPPGNYALELYIEKNMWNSYPINDKPTLRVNLQWGIYENPEFSFFGGLRIKEIKNFTSEGQLATMKKYSYLNDENKESGDFLNIPIFKERANGRFVRYTGPMCAGGQNALVIEGNCINLSSSPVISLQTVGGNYLGYTDVKEEYYDYLNPSNSYFTNDKFSFFHPFLSFEGAPYNEEWTRGQLQTSKNLVSEVENTYVNENNSLLIENFIQCYDSSKSPIFLLPIECSAYNPNWILQCQRSIGSQSYKLLDNNKSNLLHKVEKSNNVVKTTNYSYSSIINLASEKINTSTNDVLETKYFYPQDQEMNLKPAISELINHNLISSPLVTQTFFNDEKTSEKEVVYQESLLINDILSPKYIYYKKGDDFPGNDMEKKITYDFYDLNGNLTQYTLENGSPVSIIWGYNKSYPIAKIENATNQRIIQALSISNINSLTDADLPDIDALRTSLSNSMITTYTYYPLVGVHTIKDPKGDILTYQYDEFNRLEAVFDKYNNKISENQYHYRTQN